jgi:hypothetical protein
LIGGNDKREWVLKRRVVFGLYVANSRHLRAC